jgi:prepilin peptidase CpaA
MSGFHVFVLLGIALTAAAAAFDWQSGQIRDELTLGAIVFAPVSHAVVALRADATWLSALEGAGSSFAGMIVGGAVPLLLFRMGAMGGGDVKLFAALGAITLGGFVIEAEAYAFLIATIYGVAVVCRKKTWRATAQRALGLYARRPKSDDARAPVTARAGMTSIRVAPSVCAGACISAWLLWSQA